MPYAMRKYGNAFVKKTAITWRRERRPTEISISRGNRKAEAIGIQEDLETIRYPARTRIRAASGILHLKRRETEGASVDRRQRGPEGPSAMQKSRVGSTLAALYTIRNAMRGYTESEWSTPGIQK